MCDFQLTFESLKQQNFWIRLGEITEPIYYHGDIKCDLCLPADEGSFFNGNRAYMYFNDQSYVIYFDLGVSELKIMMDEDTLDILYYSIKQEILPEEARKHIMHAANIVCPSNNLNQNLEINFSELPAFQFYE